MRTYAHPVPYRDDIEQPADDEDELVRETVESMRRTMAASFEVHRHATSGTHAKSHGTAIGTLEVLRDLPSELAQGLFATPGEHQVVLRYASEPGQIDDDRAKRARGAALKVLDVPGTMLREGWTSQDFLFNTWPVLPEGDLPTYLSAIEQREEHAGHHLRTVAATMLRNPDPGGLLFERTPNLHPVAHRYYSQAPFRYGDFIAKFALTPTGEDVEAVSEWTVGRDDAPTVLRDWVSEFFATGTARYRFGVQLCTDLESMPVEDTSVEWSEDESPYQTVGVVTLGPQATFSPARRVYADDLMAWRPWYGLAAHRPLGAINRLRRVAYEELGRWRQQQNDVAQQDPRTLDEVPD